MFRAVRGWFGGRRRGHTVRLFIFELTVVTLGVLIAQWVQGLAQQRAAIAHMEDERDRARHQLLRVHLIAKDWLVAIPCLDQRMTEIMTGTGPRDHASLVRPSLINPAYTQPDDDAMVLIDRKYGHREAGVLQGMTINANNVRNVSTKIVESWGKFALIDPTNGLPGPGDVTAARGAAADIKAQLHSGTIIATDIDRRLSSIGVGASDDESPELGPAHSCAAIWRSGRMDPPLTER